MNKTSIKMKAISVVIAISLVLAPVFALSACSGVGTLMNAASSLSDVAENMQKYEEAVSKLTNYKITIESTSESGSKSILTEMRCEQGYSWISDDTITYIEYGKGKMYMLSISEKSGMSYAIENDETYKSFGAGISGYLYAFEIYRLLGAKKDGSDKIGGRNTTRYTFSAEGTDYKFWIDDEYGLTMKSSIKTSGGTSTMEVTEFKTGGVKLEDMVKLSDYEIQDLSELLEQYGG